MATLLPNGKQQFIDINGDPLAMGLVYFYIPNTTVFKNTWQDSAQQILNTNPVALDMRGQAVIYGEGVYRQVVYDVDGNLIWDQLTGSTEGSLYAGSATGSADVIVLTLSPPLTSYVDGAIIEFKAIADNVSTTPTANVNTLGAKTIIFQNGSPLYAGAIKNGGIYQIAYSSTTDKFQLLGVPSGNSANLGLGADVVNDGSGNLTASFKGATEHSGDYTILPADRRTVQAWFLGAAATATLTAVATLGNGWSCRIINRQGSGANNLTVASPASNLYGPTFEAVSSFTLRAGEYADISISLGSSYFYVTIGRLASAVRGDSSNLKIVTADGGTGPVVTADQIVLQSSGGDSVRVSSVSVTASIDTGSIASATWYYLWAFYNPTTAVTTARYSLSATAPTAPAGSTYSAYIGEVRTKPGSAVFIGTIQYGHQTQYITPPLPVMGSGSSGSPSVPTWVAIAVAAYVPPNASRIKGYISTTVGGTVTVAPNNNYGAVTASTNTPPVSLTFTSSATASGTALFDFALESANIFWASLGANSAIVCLGWERNV